jgi:hypothetical protein
MASLRAVRLRPAVTCGTANGGADGFMLMPAMLYKATRERRSLISVTTKATGLPIMIYNNPPAMRTTHAADVLHLGTKKFVALKESSGDTRRLTDLHNTRGSLRALHRRGQSPNAPSSASTVGWPEVHAFPGEPVLWELTGRLMGKGSCHLPLATPLLHSTSARSLCNTSNWPCRNAVSAESAPASPADR